MELTLYLVPQFVELKKTKQNRVNQEKQFGRNIFVESQKELHFSTAVL